MEKSIELSESFELPLDDLNGSSEDSFTMAEIMGQKSMNKDLNSSGGGKGLGLGDAAAAAVAPAPALSPQLDLPLLSKWHLLPQLWRPLSVGVWLVTWLTTWIFFQEGHEWRRTVLPVILCRSHQILQAPFRKKPLTPSGKSR